jgi:GNAT superfamily N-acetyltransferase
VNVQLKQLEMPFGEACFRMMQERDIDRMVELGAMYFEETDWGGYSEYSPENFRKRLELTLEHPVAFCAVFTVDDVVMGAVRLVRDEFYTKEPIASCTFLYVVPEYRKGPVGRRLMDAAEQIARLEGCVAIDSNFMSGIDDVRKTFENMFVKRGYKPTWGGRKVLYEGV